VAWTISWPRAGAEADAVDYRNRSALHFSANAAVVEACPTVKVVGDVAQMSQKYHWLVG